MADKMRKIKDLTLEECKKICKESSCCDDCQIKNICYGFYNIRSIDLNQNIEMIDVPVEEPKTNEMSVQNIFFKGLEIQSYSLYKSIDYDENNQLQINLFAVFKTKFKNAKTLVDEYRMSLTQEEYDYLEKELLHDTKTTDSTH